MKTLERNLYTLSELSALVREGDVAFSGPLRLMLADWLDELVLSRKKIHDAQVALAGNTPG